MLAFIRIGYGVIVELELPIAQQFAELALDHLPALKVAGFEIEAYLVRDGRRRGREPCERQGDANNDVQHNVLPTILLAEGLLFAQPAATTWKMVWNMNVSGPTGQPFPNYTNPHRLSIATPFGEPLARWADNVGVQTVSPGRCPGLGEQAAHRNHQGSWVF